MIGLSCIIMVTLLYKIDEKQAMRNGLKMKNMH